MFQNQDVFPTTNYYDKTPTGCSEGLNARQYFAIKALQGLLSNSATKDLPPADVVKLAVHYADALIVEV